MIPPKSRSAFTLTILVLALILSFPPQYQYNGTLAKSGEKLERKLEGKWKHDFFLLPMENRIETASDLSLNFEWSETLEFDIDLGMENDRYGRGLQGANFDLEIEFPRPENEIDIEETTLGVGADFDEGGFRRTKVSLETELFGTDLGGELELDFHDGSHASLKTGKWFRSGASMKGEIEFGPGFKFKESVFRTRGIDLTIKDKIWELGGRLEFKPEGKSPFEGSLSLEREEEKYFGLPQKRDGISIWQLSLYPHASRELEILEVTLYNPFSEPRNLNGWSLRSKKECYVIEAGQIIPPKSKLKIRLKKPLLERRGKIHLINPAGKVVDTWKVSRLPRLDGVFLRREGVFEKEFGFEFDEEGFDELTAGWGWEIPLGNGVDFIALCEIDHLFELEEGELGLESETSELTISIPDRELELELVPPLAQGFGEFQIEMTLNQKGDFDLELESETEWKIFEVESALELSRSADETEIETEHLLKWKWLEISASATFEDSVLEEIGFETEVDI